MAKKQKTHLETSRAPINKLDGPLGLDDADGSINILGDNITTVQHAAKNIKIQYLGRLGIFIQFTHFSLVRKLFKFSLHKRNITAETMRFSRF